MFKPDSLIRLPLRDGTAQLGPPIHPCIYQSVSEFVNCFLTKHPVLSTQNPVRFAVDIVFQHLNESTEAKTCSPFSATELNNALEIAFGLGTKYRFLSLSKPLQETSSHWAAVKLTEVATGSHFSIQFNFLEPYVQFGAFEEGNVAPADDNMDVDSEAPNKTGPPSDYYYGFESEPSSVSEPESISLRRELSRNAPTTTNNPAPSSNNGYDAWGSKLY